LINKKRSLINGWDDYFKSHPLIHFISLFSVSLLLLQIILHLPFIAQPLTWLTTRITWQILAGIGLPVTMEGFFIMSPRAVNMEIIYECTGIYGIMVYLSAIIATHAPIILKLKGIWFGLIIIWIMNLVRLVSIYWITYEYPPIFDFLHTYFWQFFLILIVILTYIGWHKKVIRYHSGNKARSS
jgi:exosortase/archaeosortase family protein